jgi:hypothetical protein
LKLRHVIALGSWLALSACAASPQSPVPAGSVRVAPDLFLTLPKPSSLGRSLEATQLVTAHYGDQTYVFEGHLSATPNRLLLLGLDSMGRKAMTIIWSDDGLHTETAPWLPVQLRPENMLADIVMIYWPAEQVSAALAASGGRVTVSSHSRAIADAQGLVIQASYSGDDPWNGSLRYSNLAWGYSLDVQSAEVRP